MQWDKKKLCMHLIQQKFQSSETFMAARPREIPTESRKILSPSLLHDACGKLSFIVKLSS